MDFINIRRIRMKKLLVVVLLAIFLMPFAALPAFATEKATDVGNKWCPVSGEPVSGTSFVEYQGKRYGLCCLACEKMFLSDPARYIAQMEAKEKTSAPAASASEEMERDMEEGDL